MLLAKLIRCNFTEEYKTRIVSSLAFYLHLPVLSLVALAVFGAHFDEIIAKAYYPGAANDKAIGGGNLTDVDIKAHVRLPAFSLKEVC